jgi:Cu(I)/Ag(I) efflux system membrane protein CusA/SilA
MYLMGLTTNIMSLAGIAISIGVLVDGAIIEVENAYKKTQLWDAGGRKEDYHAVLLGALKEVGPSVFFSLLVIAVAFLPVFTLLDQEGRLFRPLAFSKNFAMAIAAILAITLNPAMRMMFPPSGKYYPEEKHPVSKVLFRMYEPVCRFVLNHRRLTLVSALVLMLATIPIFFKLGSEFMPPLNEGTVLYMPTTLPGISVTEAQKLLQQMDKAIKTIPEVERVFGKAGRAETSTDPAPFSMMETTIILKPQSEWTRSWDAIIADLDAKVKFPGVSNAWTMPIKARIDMLSTGIRTPVGIKIYGADLAQIEKIGLHVERIVKEVKGARSVFAERVTGGYFVDFDIKRDQLARYGLSIKDVEEIIMSAIGGEPVTTTVEGRERYSVNVRYARELRDDIPALKRVLVPTASGTQIPIGQLAEIKLTTGPAMIRDENGMLAGYVYVDIAGRDVGSFVTEAKKTVERELTVPTGYSLQWSGQFENMLRVRERLKVVIPITLFLIFFLLYLNTRSAFKAGIVMLAVPFSLVGAVWFLWILGYNMSIAVWVGMIALMGLDAETGVFMLLFLDHAYDDAVRAGTMRSDDDLKEAIVHGAVKRIRPKLMTVAAMFMGLIPIMWASGAGADVMKRIAAPMIGGVFSSFALELLVYPVVYFIWKRKELRNRANVMLKEV